MNEQQDPMPDADPGAATDDAAPSSTRVAVVIAAGVAVLIAIVVGLHLRTVARTNHVALAAAPRPVSVVKAKAASFRPSRSYVGTIQPWVAAKIGPQFVSAYVGSVLVRPGASVRRGEVLATLDCRNSSAASREIAARARALEERQIAAEHEAARLKELTAGGYASTNEEEQLAARAKAEAAEVEGLRASLVTRALEVDDCILRAPFAGEIADRFADPGAYVRPGNPIVTAIDRSTVRIVADAPESDFAVVAPDTAVAITVLSTGARLAGAISRRAPAADDVTRTVHFEIDLPNAGRKLPVGTTATIAIEVGAPEKATAVPLRAATVRGEQAALFVVEGALAKSKTLPLLGEAAGLLYLDPRLPDGSLVVVEGRALLDDGDRVAAREAAE
jgi:RND family efflux transporter MFP subunit